MTLFKRLAIRVTRRRRTVGRQVKVTVKEKDFYQCSVCNNRYASSHFFCPQCLGEVRSGTGTLYSLTLDRVPKERIDEIFQLIGGLAGGMAENFRKSLRRPWKIFDRSDLGVLQQWREVFEAEKLKAAIEPAEREGKNRKGPLFTSAAPLPRFFSAATEEQIRLAGKTIQNAGVRLRWVEVVVMALQILEHCYKRRPADRILFTDYLFQIDQRLLEAAKDLQSSYKNREEDLVQVVDSIRTSVQQMATDMEEVRKQVDAQL
jgi:hypothetical protein